MKHIALGLAAAFIFLCTLSLECLAQDGFIWVPHGQESQHPGYSRVIGGKLNDGTALPVCRAVINGFQVPGKFYNSSCIMPWNGIEKSNRATYDILMTNIAVHWRAFHDTTKAQIQAGAVPAGAGQASTGAQYFCRRQMQDGLHPGKYASGNGFCYVSWGGKEYNFADGFDILFR